MADTKKEAIYYGTGRRKNAIARVRLVPGTGKVTVNKRDAEDYFGRKALVEFATAPFTVTGTAKHFDVIATLNGGGISGQAGALRHGIAALCSRLAITAPSSRRPASSRAIRVWSSARSTVSRRPASVRSSPSAKFREIYMQEEGSHLRAFFLLPTALSPAVPAPHRLHRVRQPLPRGSNLP